MSKMQRVIWGWCIAVFAVSLLVVFLLDDTARGAFASRLFLAVFAVVSVLAWFFVRKNFDARGQWVGAILKRKG